MPLALLLAGLLTADAGSARPTSPPPPELVALQQHLAGIGSLKARFTQKRHWAALKDTLVSEGTIAYERGGKLVWRTEKPSESELVYDGKTAQMRFPKLGTTQSFDLSAEPGMAQIFNSITAVLQADLERMAPLYDVTVAQKAPLELELVPKSKEVGKVIQRIRLGFDAKLNLARVSLDEAGGDKTEISFRDQLAQPGPKR